VVLPTPLGPLMISTIPSSVSVKSRCVPGIDPQGRSFELTDLPIRQLTARELW